MEIVGSEGFFNLLLIYFDYVLYLILIVSIVWSIVLKLVIVKWSFFLGIVFLFNVVIWFYIKF